MTARRPRRLKAAIVHWLDAYEYAEHEPNEPGFPQISVGILVAKNRKFVKLAKTAAANPGPHDDDFGDVLTIPAGMVRSIEVIPIETPPRLPPAPRRSRKPPAPPGDPPPPPGDEPS